MVSLKIRNFRFWVLCLGTENMGLIFVFNALVVWGVWNLVLSFVFRPIWDWIQVFWVLNFMFIFSKPYGRRSMAETPWSKIHGRNPPWSRFDLLSLSKPRWSPWFDVTSSWLCFGVFYWWGLALSFVILFFIWLCFGFFLFYYYYFD